MYSAELQVSAIPWMYGLGKERAVGNFALLRPQGQIVIQVMLLPGSDVWMSRVWLRCCRADVVHTVGISSRCTKTLL